MSVRCPRTRQIRGFQKTATRPGQHTRASGEVDDWRRRGDCRENIHHRRVGYHATSVGDNAAKTISAGRVCIKGIIVVGAIGNVGQSAATTVVGLPLIKERRVAFFYLLNDGYPCRGMGKKSIRRSNINKSPQMRRRRRRRHFLR